MNVLLINIDSVIPNLALHKIAKWHESKGDNVIWDLPIRKNSVDKVYASCVFSKNRQQAIDWAADGADVGGSGYDLHKKLPPDIENIECRINIGFTTRGCIRHCQFCIVPDKEGYVQAVGDLYSIWDGSVKYVTLLDNNILALPDHFAMVSEQARKEKVKLDHSQGLDHRLLTPELCDILKRTPCKTGYTFAFDHPSYIFSVDKAITMLQREGIARCKWYVLVGFNTTIAQDFERLEYLKSRNQIAYVMRYEGANTMIYNDMAAWANQYSFFRSMSFDEFVKIRHKRIDSELDQTDIFRGAL